VQVVPELMEAGTGTVKWQQSFDTEVADVFAVQSQIATRVAGALGVALGGAEAQEIAERPTANVESYKVFLRGRAAPSGSPAGRREAATFYEQAVALDSTFALAWSALSIAMTRIHINDAPSEVNKKRARDALERSRALDPNGARTHLAAARYLYGIEHELDAASKEMDVALQAAPRDAEVLSFAATLDEDRGDLAAAKAKLERAREADPRSVFTLQRLTQLYGRLQQPVDMENVASAWVAVTPTDPTAVQQLAMSFAMRGDLDGARAAIQRALAQGASAPEVAANFAGREEVAWILAERERGLVFRLTPAAFDNDRAFWGQSLATAYWQEGDVARARAYADSALAESAAQARTNPKDGQLVGLYALMLGYLGRTSEARAASAQSLAVADRKSVQYWYEQLLAARTELALGDTARALDHLEQAVKTGSYINGRWLGVDPMWTSLKGNPRFEQLRQLKP
jgi:Flp pilus assembly protein TadD